MASAFHPTPRARLRGALGLAAALATLSLGAAPAVSAPLDLGLFTLPEAPDQPTPAPTPSQVELRPVEPPLLDRALLPEPAPPAAPAPGPEPAPLLASSLGALDDAGRSILSQLTGGSSSTPSGEDSGAVAEAPQRTGSPTPEPTTGVAAPGAGAGDQGAGAVSPATRTPSGTVTAATLMPVIDAVSRPIGPSRRSREIAPTGPGGRSRAPVRVASGPLGPLRAAAPTGSTAPGGAAPRPTPAPAIVADPPRDRPVAAAIPHAAERVVGAVADAGRSPWLPIALLLATVAYLLGQRLMDGGSKLSHAGHGDEPDDELIEL